MGDIHKMAQYHAAHAATEEQRRAALDLAEEIEVKAPQRYRLAPVEDRRIGAWVAVVAGLVLLLLAEIAALAVIVGGM